jgi:hypothetical protein
MLRTLQVFSILTLLIIVWGIPRGFDFSDEGLYVVLADPNQLNSNGPILYDLFFKFVYKISGIQFHIQGLRWIRLIGTLSSVFALYLFTNQLRKEKANSSLVWVVFLGLMCSYAFLPPSLSYNTLLLIGTCWWLYFLIQKKSSRLFLAGVCIALLCYVKLPSAILLFFISILLILRENRSGTTWFLLGLFVSLFCFELTFYILFGDGLLNRINYFLTNSIARPSYSLPALFKSTGVGIFWIFLSFMTSYSSRKISIVWRSGRNPIYALGILVLAIIGWFTHITDEWNHLALLAFTAVLGWVMAGVDLKRTSFSDGSILITLIALPFVLHFGSNVYWLRLGIHFWIFWLLALYLMWDDGREFIGFSIGPLTFLLVLNGIWLNPFEQKPLWEAKYEWKYGSGNSILLNEEQVNLLESLREISGATQIDEIACAYRNPGMAYLAGMKNWGKIGFWEKSELESEIAEGPPKAMIFYSIYSLPASFSQGYQRKSVGIYQGVETEFLWK